MTIRYDGQVAIVTGAGGGLGRSHALALAARGAKVVVNDPGGDVHGVGAGGAAEAVVAEIRAAGGEALANSASVTDQAAVAEMIAEVIDRWGRVDILVNNAGILRDKSFHKMSADDFDAVMNVHLDGSVACTRAVWQVMRDQGYGRIVLTSSSSGLYGNFGQSNYGAAKMAMVGLMHTLCLEGAKYNIHVNCLAPTALTRMTEGLIPTEAAALLDPSLVTPAVLLLAAKEAPNRSILVAGAGHFARAVVVETAGISVQPVDATPEALLARWSEISEGPTRELKSGPEQTMKCVQGAMGVKADS